MMFTSLCLSHIAVLYDSSKKEATNQLHGAEYFLRS